MNNELIKSIEKKLMQWSINYYKGTPIVTDEVYDALENFYNQLNGDFNPFEVRKVDFRKTIKHWCQLTSLEKTYNIQDIAEKFENKEVIIQPKLDGLSIALQYIEGKFYKAVTRGDGIKGNDVTHIIKPYFKKYHNENLQLSESINTQIRGEFIIPLEHEKYFIDMGYKSIRNVASGLVNKKEFSDDLKYCDFIVHDVYFAKFNNILNDVLSVIDWAESNNFIVAKSMIKDILGMDDISKFNSSTANLISEHGIQNVWNCYNGKTYIIDGYVIKLRFRNITMKNGLPEYDLDRQKYPTDAIAYKSEDRMNTVTSILDIMWNMTDYKLIPKYILNPVEMDRSIIKYATAHNYKNIKQMIGKLKNNNIVSLIRAGDIIPQVKDILDYGDGDDVLSLESIPTECPYCGVKLKLDDSETNLICDNEMCSNKIIHRILKFIELMEIKNIGEKTVYKLYDKFKFKNFKDLYNSNESDWGSIEGLGQRSYNRFIKSTNSILNEITIDKVLASMCIPLHGRRTIRSLRKVWTGNDVNDIFSNESEIIKIDNYSEYKLNIFKSYYNRLKDDIDDIMSISTNTSIENCVENSTPIDVVVTGAHPVYSRRELMSIFSKNGFRISSSFKNVKYLICKDKNSSSSKMKKARNKGIDILRYDEFFDSYIKGV